jgi:CRP-like cAMP-binding protein
MPFLWNKDYWRYYSVDSKGKEHILQFAPENWLIANRESAYFGRPSQYFIQALEDSKIVAISDNFLQELSAKYPAFTEFNNKLLHNHILHLQNRINQLLSYTAEERYLKFIGLHPMFFCVFCRQWFLPI